MYNCECYDRKSSKKTSILSFSATQQKSIEILARLSLKAAVYVEASDQQLLTPDSLQKNYVIVQLEDKITMLSPSIQKTSKAKTFSFFL